MSVISEVLDKIKKQDPNQLEFHQAAQEVLETLEPTVKKHPEFVKAKIYERIVEPERVIIFRVSWADDNGHVQVNRGYRVHSITPSGRIRAACASIRRSIWAS